MAISPGTASRIGLLAVGAKGFGLAKALAYRRDLVDLRFVVTYEPRATREPGVDAFRRVLGPSGTPLIDTRRPDVEAVAAAHGEVDLVLYAGWQYLSRGSELREVVLHDSLLPRLRGFNPTVTALIEGHERIGVTAILPVPEVDAGPILAQRSIGILHPITIADALSALDSCYFAVTKDVLELIRSGELVGEPQNHQRATYSVWRDESDYALDLSMDSERVVRTVLALSDPYRGATLTYEGRSVRVHDAEVVADIQFEARQPGKVWRLDATGPVVICGRGMVRLTRLTDDDGNAVSIERLRTRFE